MKTILAYLLLITAAFGLSDTELQTESGSNWQYVVAYRATAVAEVEARAAKAEAKAKRYDELLAAVNEALGSGDLSALKVLLETKVADEAQTEKERQIADLEAQKVQADEDATKKKEQIDAKIAELQSEAAAPAEAVEK